jgi:hypothetical protein
LMDCKLTSHFCEITHSLIQVWELRNFCLLKD